MRPQQRFAFNLRDARREADISQQTLAERAGMPLSQISRLESGDRDPRLTTIVRLAHGLGVEPSQLLRRLR